MQAPPSAIILHNVSERDPALGLRTLLRCDGSRERLHCLEPVRIPSVEGNGCVLKNQAFNPVRVPDGQPHSNGATEIPHVKRK